MTRERVATPEAWLPWLPVEWQMAPAKSVFTDRRESCGPDDVHLTPSQAYGVLPQSAYMEVTGNRVVLNLEGQENMKHVEPDDFVIHLRSFQGGLERSTFAGKVSTAYTVLRPTSSASADFFRWVLKSDGYIQELRTTTNQLRDGQSIKYRDFAKVPLPLPPLVEQRAIANYLVRETAQIDALIGKQERLIETLRERRVAVVGHAFEDPDLLPYRSTLTRACLDVVDCPHTTPAVDENGAYEAVRTGSVRNGLYRPEASLRVSEETWRERNRGGRPAPGDVMFTREAPAGEACMVPDDRGVCLGQRMVLLRIDPAKAWGRFVLWQVYSKVVQDYFSLSTNGSTVGNLRLGLIRKTPVLLPPLDKQRRIADHLDEQTAKIDSLIAKAVRFIEVSKERRSAFITAAVTGQIDVRERVREPGAQSLATASSDSAEHEVQPA